MTANSEVVATDPVKTAQRLTEEQITLYKEEGYLILPGLISRKVATRLCGGSFLYLPFTAVKSGTQPGDCVAFSRLIIHGSGPNARPEHRVAYAVQFYRDDVNYSLDGGESYQPLQGANRWSVGPVERISIPEGKTDGH